MACLLPQLFKCPSDTSSLHLRAPPHLHPTTTHHNPRLPSLEAYSTSAAEAVRSLTYIGAIGPPAKSPFEVKLASEALITGEEAVIAAAVAEVVGLPKAAVEEAKDASLVAGTNPSLSSPRRPVVILPGLGNNSSDYGKLAASLKEYGIPVLVAKVSRLDWLRNAAGLLDANYWRGTLRPKPVLDWYLERVHAAISEAKLLAEGGCLSLIGHSAGGWLARVYLEEFRQSNISLLLTLGTPHLPPPKGLSGVIDQTRGLLDYVDKYCARAVYKPELRYVCVAGRYIRGARFFGNPNVTSEPKVPIDKYQPMTGMFAINNINKSTSIATAIRAWFIGQGYKQVCGQADVWGDGVVPEMSAHLEGALNISLEGVYHSPVGSDDIMRPWYGSPSVLEKWVHHLLS